MSMGFIDCLGRPCHVISQDTAFHLGQNSNKDISNVFLNAPCPLIISNCVSSSVDKWISYIYVDTVAVGRGITCCISLIHLQCKKIFELW